MTKEEKNLLNAMTEGVIWKQLLLFFFPIVLGTFFQQLYNTADAIIVGKFVGKEALAAVKIIRDHLGRTIYDSKARKERSLEKKDIVILMRGMKIYGDLF